MTLTVNSYHTRVFALRSRRYNTQLRTHKSSPGAGPLSYAGGQLDAIGSDLLIITQIHIVAIIQSTYTHRIGLSSRTRAAAAPENATPPRRRPGHHS